MNPLPDAPFLLSYKGVAPELEGLSVRADAGSAVLGRVKLGPRAELGRFAVLRGDGHVINVGSELHLGVHSTVHIAHALYGTTIGDRVAVGANAVVHACIVGNDCVIQDDVAVLDGSVIGDGSVIARGSVVFPRSVLPPGQWCEGVPAVPVRSIDTAELEALRCRVRTHAPDESRVAANTSLLTGAANASRGYVAATVTGTGEIRMGEGSSLWFGCIVDAFGYGVSIAAGSNVQDNSVLRSTQRAVTIGANSIIGHNVMLHDCTIGERVLVGMSSALAPGTVVMDDVLVAAGSATIKEQILESGWLWGGRPARALSRLSEQKRRLIQQSAEVYCEYAMDFGVAQAAALRCHAERE